MRAKNEREPGSPATASRRMSCETTLWTSSPGTKFCLNKLCGLRLCVPPASWNQCSALSIFLKLRLHHSAEKARFNNHLTQVHKAERSMKFPSRSLLQTRSAKEFLYDRRNSVRFLIQQKTQLYGRFLDNV